MDFDDILMGLQKTGMDRFQIVTYFLVCLPLFLSAQNALIYILTTKTTDYRCYIPQCEAGNKTKYLPDFVKYAIPNKNTDMSAYEPLACKMFKYKGDGSTCNKDDFTTAKQDCTSFVFADEYSLMQEFELYCSQNSHLLSLVGNAHFLGILIGTVSFGILSDRFGRKVPFITAIIFMGLGGCTLCCMSNYWGFLVISTLHAIGVSGVYPLGFVLAVEMVGPTKREMAGMVLNLFTSAGGANLGAMAWVTRHWVWYSLAIALPCFLFLPYVCLVPESVRWLIAKKKFRQAREVLDKMATANGTTVTKEMEDVLKDSGKDSDNKGSPGTMLKAMLRSKRLIFRLLIVFYLWLANVFIYYGLTYVSTFAIGGKYLTYILAFVVEVPSYMLAWLLLKKLGRKIATIGSLIFTVVFVVISVIIPDSLAWLSTVFFLLSKICITACFGIIYVYNSELFPTLIRGATVSAGSTVGRVGALFAPVAQYLASLEGKGWLPMVVFAITAAIAAVLTFFLPETVNKKLPSTIEEAENM